MDVIKDDYVVMLTSFYKKMIKRHSKRRPMMEKFNAFLAENNKERNNLSSSNRKALTNQNQYMKSANNIRQQSRSNSNLTSPQQLSKSQRCFKNQNLLYSSTSLLKVMGFVYIYHLIQTDNFKKFQQISNEIANYLVSNGIFDEITLKRVNFLWSNIGKFLTKRSKNRMALQMKQSYNQFNEDFIRLIIYVVLKPKVQYQKVDNKFAENSDFLKMMAKEMEITIVSFDINNNEIENMVKFGSQTEQIAIGFQTDQKRYVFLDQIPIVKSSMNFQTSELNKKISKTIDLLLKDYKDNTEKLMGLNFLKEINSKQAKIKKYLSIDN